MLRRGAGQLLGILLTVASLTLPPVGVWGFAPGMRLEIDRPNRVHSDERSPVLGSD